MKKYLPSEKLSDEYLASERDRLRKFVFSLFENPFKEEIRALEKIEDRYEQLKECVRLKDKMQEYITKEDYPKEIALQFLGLAELYVSDKDAFDRYFEEHSEYTVITLYELAKDFFESIENGKQEWNQYRFKVLSDKGTSEIVDIGGKFFANYPEWVKYVVRIEASKLSMKDKFMQYNPKNTYEKILKSHLTHVIQSGISDFYCFNTNPSLDNEGNICFKGGIYSVPDESYNWWREKVEMFNPMCKSRLGSKSEYIAVLGVLMKKLIDEGWRVSKVWNELCNNQAVLIRYLYSQTLTNVHYDNLGYLFTTFFQTSKFLADDEEKDEFWTTDSWANYNSFIIDIYHNYQCTDVFSNTLGWIVLPVSTKVEIPREMPKY